VTTETFPVQIGICLSIGTIESLSGLDVADRASQLEIVFAYLGPIPNMVKKPLSGPELLKTHIAMGKTTNIQSPNVFDPVALEFVKA